jgi:hypothetical protein
VPSGSFRTDTIGSVAIVPQMIDRARRIAGTDIASDRLTLSLDAFSPKAVAISVGMLATVEPDGRT